MTAPELAARIRKLESRVANVIRVGVVEVLDETAARVIVKIGGMTTAPLPWLTGRAGPDRTWWAPEPGEQVVIFSPSGELSMGIVLPAINQTTYAAPSSEKTKHKIIYSDGTILEYDRVFHKLTASVQGTAEITTTGNAKVQSGGELRLKGATIVLEGPVSATSTIEATGNITAPDANLVGMLFSVHKHEAPSAGGRTSGPLPS